MRFRGNRQRLLEALSVLATVVPSRPIKPILANLRLVVDQDGGSLLGTDLEVAVRYRVPLESIEEGGDVLLPVAKLLGILRESAADEILVTSDGTAVTVVCGSGRFRMNSADSQDFPVIPAFEGSSTFTLGSEALRTLIRKTTFATAKEKTRYAFNAVKLDLEPELARMIASDGKRMAIKSVPAENPERLTGGQLIPVKGLATFDRVLAGRDEPVRVLADDRQVMIRVGNAEVSTRLVEGAFPRHDAGVPTEIPFTLRFNREELLSGLRRAAVLTSDESRSVRMAFEEGHVVLSARAIEVGEAFVEIEAQAEGTPIDVAFNPEFLAEALRLMDAPEVRIRISGQDTPALVEGEENFLYVIMPVTRRAS